MDAELLKDLARHQTWSDAQHWKTLHANPTLLEDAEIHQRLNHMLQACRMLTKLARGEAVDPTARLTVFLAVLRHLELNPY